jgi:hypothetical protein
MPESSPGSPAAWYPDREMSYFRSLSATLLSAAAMFSLVTSSCGTNAVGVDDCRDIEQARCRASASCLDANGVPLIDDVDACERYYRDHCLHGLAMKPGVNASVATCVQVIEAAGRCAERDPASTLTDCNETEAVTEPHPGLKLACDVVTHPERAAECSFLTDVPVTEGSAGQSAGGQSGEDTGAAANAGQTSASGGETAQGGAPAE